MPAWIDQFLFWDLALVVALFFSDWLLGEKQRANMRERIGDFWLYLEDVAYSKLAAEDAKMLMGVLDKTVGSSRLSSKRLLASCVPSLILVAYLTYSVVVSSRSWALATSDLGISALCLLFVNSLADWTSLAISSFLFRTIMLGKLSAALIIFGTLCVLFFQTFLALLSIFALWWIAGLLVAASPASTLPLGPVFGLVAGTKAAPIGIFFIFALLLFVCKSFRGLLRWPVGIIALRLHESKQGVLSQLAAAVGLLAKVVQEAFKVFSQ